MDNISDKYVTLKSGISHLKEDYIIAKTKDLIEFGYSGLSTKTVAEQLEKILRNEPLNVIGMFMRDDF